MSDDRRLSAAQKDNMARWWLQQLRSWPETAELAVRVGVPAWHGLTGQLVLPDGTVREVYSDS